MGVGILPKSGAHSCAHLKRPHRLRCCKYSRRARKRYSRWRSKGSDSRAVVSQRAGPHHEQKSNPGRRKLQVVSWAAAPLLGPEAALRQRFGHRRRCRVRALWPRRFPTGEELEHRPRSGLGPRSSVLRRRSCRRPSRRGRLRLGLRRRSPDGRQNLSTEGSRRAG
jgi:hypothetical protein